MKIKCKINTLQKAEYHNLINDDIRYIFNYDPDYSILNAGQVFDVYGILLATSGIWVFILEDSNDDYPKHYPLSFFDIINADIPENWISGNVNNFNFRTRKVISFLTHPVWANDNSFYEGLVNGDQNTIELFKRSFNTINNPINH